MPCKTIHRPFKRNAWGSQNPLFRSAIIPTGFHSQKLWELLFPTLEPWAWKSGVGLGPHTPQGTSEAGIAILIFNHRMWVGASLSPNSILPTSLYVSFPVYP